MKKRGKRVLVTGIVLVVAFVMWTMLIRMVDVRPVGPNGTFVGFATVNTWFRQLTGVHMTIYLVTDWLGLIPIFVCMIFSGIGLNQLIMRRSLFKVDYDILFLGMYYAVVIAGYLIFEMIPINYRPVLIEGILEASYPSSTTLLVISVMSALIFQVNRRIGSVVFKRIVNIPTSVFMTFMVLGRLVSGVHWFTDIVGSILLSGGLFCIYEAVVLLCYVADN